MNEVEELRAVIREGHELLQDLRHTLAAVEVAKAQSLSEVQDLFDATTAAHVESKIKELGDSTQEAINLATKAVYERFDEIADILVGQSRRKVHRDQVDLKATAQAVRDGRAVVTSVDSQGVDLAPLLRSGLVKPPRAKGKK